MYRQFKVIYNNLTLVGDKLDTPESQVNLICLHGAGKAQRSRFSKLRDKLALDGVSSLAFDFIGQGDSEGVLENDSLHSRTNQALEVIRQQGEDSNLSLLATSMSAYTAIKLTEHLNIRNLILVVPAVYHRKAYKIAFNTGFSEIIRKPNNWVNSDAWSLLENFTGNLLVISAEHDEVIPKLIPEFISDLSLNANSKKFIEVADSSHQILHFINKNPHDLDNIANEIRRIIRIKQ